MQDKTGIDESSIATKQRIMLLLDVGIAVTAAIASQASLPKV
jgi:hypothetical protein